MFDIINVVIVLGLSCAYFYAQLKSFPPDMNKLLLKIGSAGLTVWFIFVGFYEVTASLYNLGKQVIISLCQYL